MLRHKATDDQQATEPADDAGRSLASRALNSVTEVGLFALAAMIVIAAIGPLAGWWHYEVVESGSMTPALRIGGVAVVEPEALSAVHVGQILAFYPPGEKYVRIHRVIALTHLGNQTWIRTKGDANNVADPGTIRLEGHTAYAEHLFLPYVGYGGVWLYKHSTRVVLEGVLLALMVGGGLFLIWGKRGEETETAQTAPMADDHAPEPAAPQLVAVAGNEPAPRLPALGHRAPKVNLDLSAERAATAATAASMAALSRMYSAGPGRVGIAGPLSGPGIRSRDDPGQATPGEAQGDKAHATR
jgi:signal peptidase